MNTRRVRRETGWRSLACSVCGPDVTHALMRSGWPKYRWFGPPATEIREYAKCLRCGTERAPDDPRPLPTVEPRRWVVLDNPLDHPMDAR